MSKSKTAEADSLYFLKILVYFLFGTVWLRIGSQNVVPIGLILGLVLAQHDRFRIDRKLEYVVLIVAAVLGLLGFGLAVTW